MILKTVEYLVKSPIIFIVILAMYCLGLWAYSVPLTGDQKVYLSIAMEMRERNEWVIPYLFDASNFLKPPFQYWATMVGWKCFGFGTFGAMFSSVVALLLSSFFTKKIYEIFFNKNGNLAALLYAGSLGTFTFGTTAQMEIWIALIYLAAWYFWLSKKDFTALVFSGVLSWVKSPLYSVLWVLGVVFEQLLQKNYKKIVSLKFVLALGVGAITGLAWYFLASRTHYAEIYSIFFRQENVAKIGGNQSSPFSMWGEFYYTLFPWLLLLIPAILAAVKNPVTGSFKNFIIFGIGYSVIPAVFFTLFPYRVNTYLYFLTPVAAIFLAQQSDLGIPTNNTLTRFFMKPISVLVGIALLIVVFRLFQGSWISVSLFIGLVLMVLFWLYGHIKFNLYFVALTSLFLVNLVRIGGIQVGEYDIRNLREYLLDHKDAKIGYWIEHKNIWHEIGMISAAIQQPIKRIYSLEDAEVFLKTDGVLILNNEQTVLASKLDCKEWSRYRRHLNFPLKEFLLRGVPRDRPDLLATHYICSARHWAD